MHIASILAEIDQSLGVYFLLFILAIVALVVLMMLSRFIGLWFQAFVSGTPISLFNIIGMSLRKIPPRIILNARITSYKAGLKLITVADLETHYMAGGNIVNVVRAMIAADKANIPLTWRQSTAIDLAGRDLLEAVKTSVNPKVIDCPDKAHGEYITAVAKDGVQLKCRARVTVRTNILQLVGGATEETIIARVGEGIVNAIGAADTHTDVLESPQRISRLVLERGLDAQTAFEILSIDIADISIGENIGNDQLPVLSENLVRVPGCWTIGDLDNCAGGNPCGIASRRTAKGDSRAVHCKHKRGIPREIGHG